MKNYNQDKFKKLIFFFVTSFATATIGFYLLSFIIPRYFVFGSLYRMFQYHIQYPAPYIFIPCFIYSILATLYSNRFLNLRASRQFIATIIIAILTIGISSPFGGMLWHFHDMQAGYFPTNWVQKMITKGFEMGLSIGWLIVILSFPYNFLGLIVCFYLTRKGANLSRIEK